MSDTGICRLLFSTFVVVVFCSAVILEQNVARGQSSDLQSTMIFLQNELGGLEALNTTMHWTNRITGRHGETHGVFDMSGFTADAASCSISYTLANPRAVVGDDVSFDLKDVQTVRVLTAEQYMKETHTANGHPEIDNVVDPPESVVIAKVTTGRPQEFWLVDEDLANRIAQALNRAAKLCGADSELSSGSTNAVQSDQQDATVSETRRTQNVTVYNTTNQASSGAQGAQYVQGLSQCTRTQYENQGGTLWIVNNCNVPVTVQLTSDSGNTWGQVDVSANNRAAAFTMGIGYNPRKDGTVYLFTCPKGSQPVLPNGSPFLARNYKGQFTCAQQ